MTDIVDAGNEIAEVFLQASLKNAKAAPVQHGVGMCLNCGAAVEGDRRWCDEECRDDWDRAQHRR